MTCTAPAAFGGSLCVCEDLLGIGNLQVGTSVPGKTATVGVAGFAHLMNNTEIDGSLMVRGGMEAEANVSVTGDLVSAENLLLIGNADVGGNMSVGGDLAGIGRLAVDGALAGCFAACVAEPLLASLGGGGFLLSRTPDGQATLFDFFTATPGKGHPQAGRAPHFEPVLIQFNFKRENFEMGGAAALQNLFFNAQQQRQEMQERLK